MKDSEAYCSRLWMVLCFTLISAAPVHAQQRLSPIEEFEIGIQAQAMPPNELNLLRGGFVDNSGAILNFGLDRLVNIDGAALYEASFRVSLGQRGVALKLPAQAGHVQVGEGNLHEIGAFNDAFTHALSTVIQNNADGKVIQTINRMNIELSRVGKMSQQGANSLLLPALVQSLKY